MLAALGTEGVEGVDQQARAYVGALMMHEGLRDLQRIRKMLTPRE